ncbi:MAG: hypothetical protein EOO31_07375 [Comamonadaceae bacterium]|nr:MAG: hypothetical protein EOO31_07375 [Comamonadaceae bacterium]
MTDALIADAGSQMPSGRFHGREDFRQLVRDALACAARQEWAELVICDANFQDWPLGERAVVESLQAWSRRGRRFTMLACHYDEVVRRHARFVQWRGTWSHIIECRRASSAGALELPSAIWSPSWVLHRLDPERCSGITGSEPDRRVALRESLDEWLLRKSSPGFPATTLGL